MLRISLAVAAEGRQVRGVSGDGGPDTTLLLLVHHLMDALPRDVEVLSEAGLMPALKDVFTQQIADGDTELS